MRLAVVLGTRPEIIKMSPVVRVLEREGLGMHAWKTRLVTARLEKE